MGGLPNPLEAADIWRDIWFQEAHHSTAIEGNTLVLAQVERLLAEGRAVGDKELREYMEVKGYADAAEWIYSQARGVGGWSTGNWISITELRQVHRMAMSPVWEVAPHPNATEHEGPGGFRRHDHQSFPGGLQTPTWPIVDSMVSEWLAEANGLPARSELFPELLAVVHHRFECIHPFIDGNGRTGRLVLNLVLIRMGYPPAIIFKRQRSDYLAALRRADHGDPGSLGELLARAILDNLYKFIVPAVAGPARLVPITALANESVSHTALRIAAFRGRLKATQGPDGQWRSCRNWVDEYLSGRHRRASDR
jgi:Fic family protein